MNISFVNRILIIAVYAVISFSNAAAQDASLETTLETARQLRNSGEFENAAKLLRDYNKEYPDNEWLMRLYAETLYWMEEYEKSMVVYSRANKLYPNDYDIIYEYSLMLFSWGKYNECIPMLEKYISKYDNVSGAYSLLGISYYYSGSYTKAKINLEKSLELNPDDKKTGDIYDEVRRIVSPWISLGTYFTYDSQPLNVLTPTLGFGKYFNPIINLSLEANYQMFTNDTIDAKFKYAKIKNDIAFSKAGFNAGLYTGYYSTSTVQETKILWGISLKQRLANNLFLEAATKKDPYIFTPYAAVSSFTTQRSSASIERVGSGKWHLKAGYIHELFPDDNYTQTAYAWILSSAIKANIFEFYLGYAFSYSDSKESRFVPEKTISEIIDNDLSNSITGVYNPYFTPHQQFTNSIIANVLLKAGKKTNIKIHSSTGVFSTALNPYLYLDYNNANKLVLRREYYQERYLPLDVGLDFESELGSNVVLRCGYSYVQTLYFHTSNFNLNLKIFI